MGFFSIRRKIFLALVAATLIFVSGMIFLTQFILRGQLTGLLEGKGVAIGRLVAADCVNPVITGQYFKIEMMFKDMQAEEKELVYAFVLDEEGMELTHTFEGSVPSALKQANLVPPSHEIAIKSLQTSRGPVLDIGFPLLRGDVGELHLGFSKQEIDADVNHIIMLILLLALVSLTLAGGMMFIFTRVVVTQPLTDLSSAVEVFGQGQIVEPIPVHSEDEIGLLTKTFNQMAENRQIMEKEREKIIGELQQALIEINTLQRILPICSSCKKIRTDEGSWQQIESYLREHADLQFTHGICPECTERLYPEYWQQKHNKDS